MASTRLFSVLLLATFACQSLSQVTGPLDTLSKVEEELAVRSPVDPKEVKVNKSIPNDEKVLEMSTETVKNALEIPTEVTKKAFKDAIEVKKVLERPTEGLKKAVEEATMIVDKALQDPSEVFERALKTPTENAKEALGAYTPDEGSFEPLIEELPAWTAPKFIEAADKITKTIKEELTKVATSLIKEGSKRSKRDLFDQMTDSSNDIDNDLDENKVDVDFVFLDGKPAETNTVRPLANPMNAQRYYYQTSTPQTTPEYYRYMPAAPEYTVEVSQENMMQSTSQAILPHTSATTTETPTATQYYQQSSSQAILPQTSATTTETPTATQYYQTPQYYQVSATQAATTPVAVSESQVPFYPQYSQGYPTSAKSEPNPAATQAQGTLFEEMTDNVESQIVEEEGMPKITHTSRTSTYKVSQSYPHESAYKQPQQMHYYFMLQ